MTPSYALLSVADKTGITEFARELVALGWKLVSSGGTAKTILEHDIPVTDIAMWVGGEATKGHLVVTLGRETHTAILSQDLDEIEAMGVGKIGLVCCDMYHMKDAIAKPGATHRSVIDQTDIGGPTMLRSGFKSSFLGDRIVVCDPRDRPEVIQRLKTNTMDDVYRLWLAVKAEFTVAKYCATSAIYHGEGLYEGILGTRVAECKYGENAWQTPAALYSTGSGDPLALDKFRLIEGSPLSMCNYCDLDRLLQILTHVAAIYDFNGIQVPFIAIGVKHGNACGAAIAGEKTDAIQKMILGDLKAIFGGFVITNFAIDAELADLLLSYKSEKRRILDGIIAPAFSDEAIQTLKRKGDKCRFLVPDDPWALLRVGAHSLDITKRFRPVRGGFLVQPNYTFVPRFRGDENWWPDKPSILDETYWHDLFLAWAVGSTSNSNTVTLVKNDMLIGNAVAQQDRVSACQLALKRVKDAGHNAKGAYAYSDSFFPFPDGPHELADAGIRAIFATRGSVNDEAAAQVLSEHNVIFLTLPDSEARGFFGH